jgi:hypothetical protein
MASNGSELFSSLLQRFDELVEAAQQELKLPEKPSTWIPATILSHNVSMGSRSTSKHGEIDDRSKWGISYKYKTCPPPGTGCHTIVGNTGLAEGIHYWEVTVLSQMVHPAAIGVVFPGDDAQLNINNLIGILGETRNDLLYGNAVEISLKPYVTTVGKKGLSVGGRRGPSNSHDGTIIGFRFGFLLDFVRSELKLYVFYPGNMTSSPNYEFLIATLLKGRKYYPAFSLNIDTAFQVDTNPVIPTTISTYKEKMDNMMEHLRHIRTALASAEAMAQTNTAQYHHLRERFQQLSSLLNVM